MQVWIIDKNGFYAGESKFVQEVTDLMTTVPLLVGYVKPKFNGTEWTEGATEEEVEAWKQSQQIDICIPPPTNEDLHNQLVETQKLCLSLQKQILLK